MKKVAPLLLSLALMAQSVHAGEVCLAYYGSEAINYQLMMQQLIMSFPLETRIALLKQAQLAQTADISQVGPTQLEGAFFMHLAKSHQEGTFNQKFDEAVQALFQLPQVQAKTAGMPEEKKTELVGMLKNLTLGEIQLRGFYAQKLKGNPFEADIWSKMAANLTKVLADVTTWMEISPFQKLAKIDSLIKENDLGKSQLAGTQHFEYLIDGPRSFAKRDEVIANAKKSIHVLTWSIYDDATGIKFADQMIEKKKQGVDVKIIVDALTAQKSGHNAQIQRLIQNGIEVILSSNPSLASSGQHRKAMIIDGAHVIAGGMNYGDVYSHLAGNVKWRDTDVYFTGSLATQTQNVFVTEWNEQIYFRKTVLKDPLPFQRMAKEKVVPSASESKALLINSNPVSQGLKGSPILASVLALIKSSKKEIIIENAYIISNPILESTLKEAIDRGVKVTIITNSSKSVDEPVISNPILASALRLKKLGATVVLKKGDTLHSKVALFDGEISLITSYNIHPRSEIIEDEMAFLSADPKGAQELRLALQNDIQINTVVKDDSDIVITNDPLMMFVNRVFYNQL